jgi:hypothetical protein
VVDDDFTGDIVIATTVAAGDQSGARLWHTLKNVMGTGKFSCYRYC